jgi:hypothetical protein
MRWESRTIPVSEPLIPAAPGWRVCVWSREAGSAIALEVVAWERERYTLRGNTEHPERVRLRPYVLTEFGEQVEPLGEHDLFVAIMPPRSELADFIEAAEQAAKAEQEAEEREERRREAERERET